MYNIRCEGFYNKNKRRDLSIYCTGTSGMSAALVGNLLMASKIIGSRNREFSDQDSLVG